MHEEKGVKFYPNVGVKNLLSKKETNVVSHVTLSDGQTLEAEVVIVGTGEIFVNYQKIFLFKTRLQTYQKINMELNFFIYR